MNESVKIERLTIGRMNKRVVFDVWVGGEYVGRYKTKKEAEEKASARIRNNEQYWDSISSEFDFD